MNHCPKKCTRKVQFQPSNVTSEAPTKHGDDNGGGYGNGGGIFGNSDALFKGSGGLLEGGKIMDGNGGGKDKIFLMVMKACEAKGRARSHGQSYRRTICQSW